MRDIPLLSNASVGQVPDELTRLLTRARGATLPQRTSERHDVMLDDRRQCRTIRSEQAGNEIPVLLDDLRLASLREDLATEDHQDVIYLASPSASYVTGETISVDGGFLAAGLD